MKKLHWIIEAITNLMENRGLILNREIKNGNGLEHSNRILMVNTAGYTKYLPKSLNCVFSETTYLIAPILSPPSLEII